MTKAEFRLWMKLRNRQLGGLRFRRQVPLGQFIVDFLCPERMLVVEVDGGQHGFPIHEAADARRDAWLRAQGNVVLRVSNRDVMTNIDGVCETILAIATSRLDAVGSYPSPKTASATLRRFSALPQGEG